jgi:cobalt/nickel transport protein
MVERGGISRNAFMVVVAMILATWLFSSPALAHFHVYWPQAEGCYAKPGEQVKWQYFWGHPFEMLIDDAQPPKIFMFTPQKKKESLEPQEITLKDQASGQDRKAFSVDYTPPGLGDYYLCLESPPYFIPAEQEFWQDYVKEPLHVMAEKGWDQSVGLPVEILPITRPYGWPAGSVFKGQALAKNKALTRATVDIEKFNGFFVPRDKLPRDRLGEENSPLIARVTKTDRMGYFICTLDSPGWWIISVSAPGGKKVHERKTYPLEMRGCLWIYVEPPPPPLTPPGK